MICANGKRESPTESTILYYGGKLVVNGGYCFQY